MPLKKSFFDKAVFRKDLTRFAPMMVLYTLCLLMGVTLMYTEGNSYTRHYWFAHYMCQCINVMAVVNLVYGAVVAMLLFGDLFNSRMCNALHAMPLTRDTFFFTHIAAGMLFSLIPTLVMTLVAIPMLMGTRVADAWQIAPLWYVASNLEFVCFFGIAIFCVFCSGNRLSMGLIYAGLNAAATLVYMLVDCLYTPMLHGVTTGTQLSELLTPVLRLANSTFLEVEDIYNATRNLSSSDAGKIVSFWVNPEYARLAVWALVGVGFALLGRKLYRRRELECAGDAVAFRILEPVYQIGFSLCAAVVSLIVTVSILSTGRQTGVLGYASLLCGLVAGWFAAKMFLSRNIRVFQLRNWKGLGVLTLCLALSLTLTYFDVFRVDDWVPKAQNVRSVHMVGDGCTLELTEEADIQKVLQLQQLALEDRVEAFGSYPLRWLDAQPEGRQHTTHPEEGFWYRDINGNEFNNYGDYSDGDPYDDGTRYDLLEPHAIATQISLTYTLTSGREVSRYYKVWTDQEEGEILRDFLNRWDVVWNYSRSGWKDEVNLERPSYLRTVGDNMIPTGQFTAEMLNSLLEAVKADCAEGHMAQSSSLHTGSFTYQREDDEYADMLGKIYYTDSLYCSVYTYVGDTMDTTGFQFGIYADSAHTLKWFHDRGMLLEYQVYPLSYTTYLNS